MGIFALLIVAIMPVFIYGISREVRSKKKMGRDKILANTLMMTLFIIQVTIIGEHIAGHFFK